MPTLEGFNGASLVPDIMGSVSNGLQVGEQVRGIMRDRQSDGLAEQAYGGSDEALMRLSRINPGWATAIDTIRKNKDVAEASRLRKATEERARQAYNFMQIPKERNDLRMRYIDQLAQERFRRGESIDDLVRFAGLESDAQEVEANNLIHEAASLDELLKPMFGGGTETFGNRDYVESDRPGFMHPVVWDKLGNSTVNYEMYVPEKTVYLNAGDRHVPVGGTTGKTLPLPEVKISESPDTTARLDPNRAEGVASGQAAGTVKGTAAAEREIDAPAAAVDAQATIEGLRAAQKDVKSLIPRANWKTTGPLGALMSKIPGTEAYDYKASLQTVKSRMGLDTLIALKKQGGTLGAVSEKELDLLLANIANLEQAQNDGQFVAGLEAVIKQYDRLINRVNSELTAKYKKPQGKAPGSPASANRGSAPADAIQYLRNNPTPGMKAAFKAKYGYLPEGM